MDTIAPEPDVWLGAVAPNLERMLQPHSASLPLHSLGVFGPSQLNIWKNFCADVLLKAILIFRNV
jgi:hypothetical protein